MESGNSQRNEKFDSDYYFQSKENSERGNSTTSIERKENLEANSDFLPQNKTKISNQPFLHSKTDKLLQIECKVNTTGKREFFNEMRLDEELDSQQKWRSMCCETVSMTKENSYSLSSPDILNENVWESEEHFSQKSRPILPKVEGSSMEKDDLTLISSQEISDKTGLERKVRSLYKFSGTFSDKSLSITQDNFSKICIPFISDERVLESKSSLAKKRSLEDCYETALELQNGSLQIPNPSNPDKNFEKNIDFHPVPNFVIPGEIVSENSLLTTGIQKKSAKNSRIKEQKNIRRNQRFQMFIKKYNFKAYLPSQRENLLLEWIPSKDSFSWTSRPTILHTIASESKENLIHKNKSRISNQKSQMTATQDSFFEMSRLSNRQNSLSKLSSLEFFNETGLQNQIDSLEIANSFSPLCKNSSKGNTDFSLIPNLFIPDESASVNSHFLSPGPFLSKNCLRNGRNLSSEKTQLSFELEEKSSTSSWMTEQKNARQKYQSPTKDSQNNEYDEYDDVFLPSHTENISFEWKPSSCPKFISVDPEKTLLDNKDGISEIFRPIASEKNENLIKETTPKVSDQKGLENKSRSLYTYSSINPEGHALEMNSNLSGMPNLMYSDEMGSLRNSLHKKELFKLSEASATKITKRKKAMRTEKRHKLLPKVSGNIANHYNIVSPTMTIEIRIKCKGESLRIRRCLDSDETGLSRNENLTIQSKPEISNKTSFKNKFISLNVTSFGSPGEPASEDNTINLDGGDELNLTFQLKTDTCIESILRKNSFQVAKALIKPLKASTRKNARKRKKQKEKLVLAARMQKNERNYSHAIVSAKGLETQIELRSKSPRISMHPVADETATENATYVSGINTFQDLDEVTLRNHRIISWLSNLSENIPRVLESANKKSAENLKGSVFPLGGEESGRDYPIHISISSISEISLGAKLDQNSKLLQAKEDTNDRDNSEVEVNFPLYRDDSDESNHNSRYLGWNSRLHQSKNLFSVGRNNTTQFTSSNNPESINFDLGKLFFNPVQRNMFQINSSVEEPLKRNEENMSAVNRYPSCLHANRTDNKETIRNKSHSSKTDNRETSGNRNLSDSSNFDKSETTGNQTQSELNRETFNDNYSERWTPFSIHYEQSKEIWDIVRARFLQLLMFTTGELMYELFNFIF